MTEDRKTLLTLVRDLNRECMDLKDAVRYWRNLAFIIGLLVGGGLMYLTGV